MKKNLLLICGGGGSEHSVSLNSSKYMKSKIDSNKYNIIDIEINDKFEHLLKRWHYISSKICWEHFDHVKDLGFLIKVWVKITKCVFLFQVRLNKYISIHINAFNLRHLSNICLLRDWHLFCVISYERNNVGDNLTFRRRGTYE